MFENYLMSMNAIVLELQKTLNKMKLQQGMYECNFYKLNLNKIKKDKNASITRQWKKLCWLYFYVGFNIYG